MLSLSCYEAELPLGLFFFQLHQHRLVVLPLADVAGIDWQRGIVVARGLGLVVIAFP